MFERFTDKARTIIVQAQQEARKMGHNFVGTEQILLGMMAEGENQAASALSDMAINLDDARHEVEQIIGLGSGFVDEDIPFTPRAKRVFELALDEADKLDSESIEPKHLLIGIMREGDGVAAAVVRKLASSTEDIIENFYRSFEGE
ncbi:hypothetical protein IQ260_00860 [Leptolyngbya cf. ectocarpi LEGE 11479]|uniref:Clp R domain-containing protein n=2 Tax=Leptolyngbya ectocarpi TaxID=1202 RepID=A0A928ZSH7_LEPEC|nr:hypothetical protein [Leptolyngbya cf. ectocarpi LEGE 11479]